MRIVANTTPLSELFKIGHLDLLQTVYTQIIIPEAVSQELQRAPSLPQLGQTVENSSWITVHSIIDPEVSQKLVERYPYIHAGEAAAITLAQTINATRIILDDRRARQVAQTEGLPLIGTVGVVLLAYRLGHLTSSEGKKILDRLFQGTAYISQQLYHEANKQLEQ